MATKTSLEILQHLEARLLTIKVASGYSCNIANVDREYKERAYETYPFFFINDIDDKYARRICKDLYRKILIVQIIGFIYDDRRSGDVTAAQLGTTLQNLKADLSKCLANDTYFNTDDIEMQILEIKTDEGYVPPQASFVANIAIIHYEGQ